MYNRCSCICSGCVNTECGPSSGHGLDTGSADQSSATGNENGATSVGDDVKQELDKLSDSVKTEAEDAGAKKDIAMSMTPVESDANDVSSTVLSSESDAPAADAAKQDGSDIKSEDTAMKEEEDTMENDEQNADSKQSVQYWNYHWPKVSDILCI